MKIIALMGVLSGSCAALIFGYTHEFHAMIWAIIATIWATNCLIISH